MSKTQFVLIIGPCGCGKTTVGRALASVLGEPWQLVDADWYHSCKARVRMQHGKPLSDEYRRKWIARLGCLVKRMLEDGFNVILACSALQRRHREFLRKAGSCRIVYLRTGPELLTERLRSRDRHFANVDLLPSQLETFEEPVIEERATVFDTHDPPQAIARAIASLVAG